MYRISLRANMKKPTNFTLASKVWNDTNRNWMHWSLYDNARCCTCYRRRTFFLLVSALLGLLMLFLSVGINNSNPQLSETNQLVPEEMVEIIDKVLGEEENMSEAQSYYDSLLQQGYNVDQAKVYTQEHYPGFTPAGMLHFHRLQRLQLLLLPHNNHLPLIQWLL